MKTHGTVIGSDEAFAFVLSELCVRPTCSLSDRAWMVGDRVYERWNGPVYHRGGMRQCLTDRAAGIRNHQLRPPGSTLPVEFTIPDPVIANSSQHLEQYPSDPLAVETASLDIFRDVLTDVGLYQNATENPLPYPSMPCDGYEGDDPHGMKQVK